LTLAVAACFCPGSRASELESFDVFLKAAASSNASAELGVVTGQVSTFAVVEADSQTLFNFKDSDIKFNLQSLMNILRDGRHEGWVLGAYPDPKTKRPLIGAGFSLDVPAREHIQRDPLNPHPFLEPSSAQLWQAAGLEPERLDRILNQYKRELSIWSMRSFRRKIRSRSLSPDVTDEEAMRLLRISAIQAVYNAKAYCRRFDYLTPSQQMALSQLVFQMGVNLEEFIHFLDAVNSEIAEPETVASNSSVESPEVEHWKAVQNTLINSQWAKLYSGRAASVIAMLDPTYSEDPSTAQNRVERELRPIAFHRRLNRSGPALRVASLRGHSRARYPLRSGNGNHRRKRKAT